MVRVYNSDVPMLIKRIKAFVHLLVLSLTLLFGGKIGELSSMSSALLISRKQQPQAQSSQCFEAEASDYPRQSFPVAQ